MKKLVLLLTLFMLVINAQPISEKSEQKFAPTILKNVKELYSAKTKGTKTTTQIRESFNSSLMPVDEDLRVLLKVRVEKVNQHIKNLLISKGCEIKNNNEYDLYVWIPFDKLEEISSLEEVMFITSKGIVGRREAVIGEGYTLIRGSEAQDYFYVDGAGVSVGVISDGMAYSSDSRSNGDLGNVYAVDNTNNTTNYPGSEGTAMMEIIYDFAPGAEYWFGGINETDGPLDFADRITHLQQAGCRVIVDDLYFSTGYSYFQEMEISTAINQFISAKNGCYISAVGNESGKMYTGTNYSVELDKFLKFNNSTTQLQFTPSVNDDILIALQWADSWYNPVEDFDLYIYNGNNQLIGSSTNRGSTFNPEEFCVVSVTAGQNYYAKIKWLTYTPSSSNREIKVLFDWDSQINLNLATRSREVFGHLLGDKVIGTAATEVTDGLNVEDFSSRGPAVIFTSGGNVVTIQQPKITAPDGVQTYVGQQGNFGNGDYFYGTSAAAPHVAGLATLFYSEFPSSNYQSFLNAMSNSSITMNDGGSSGNPNYTSGYGRADALGTLIEGMIISNNVTFVGTKSISTHARYKNPIIASGAIVSIEANATMAIGGSLTFSNQNSKLKVYGTLILEVGATVNDYNNIIVLDQGRMVDLSGASLMNVTVEQKLSSGASTSSSLKPSVWQFSTWSDFDVPKTFSWYVNSNQTLRANQSISSGEKYNRWNTLSNVSNHKSFNIDAQTDNLTANFEPVYSGIIIKNNSIEGIEKTFGNINFKDPWFIDSLDADYGNSLRNRGTDAVFNTRSSPFNPDYSTTYENNQPYQGVFLNQDYNIPGQPYYSVKAPAQTININGNNHQIYFLNWSATNAALQYFTSAETGVAFHSDNAVVTANYKGSLLSSTNNALRGASQRKIARTSDGYYHLVYESMGRVWYEMSTDNGATWTIRNNGQPLGINARYPSISSYLTYTVIAFVESEGSGTNIRLMLFGTDYDIAANSYVAKFYSSPADCKPVVSINMKDYLPHVCIAWEYGNIKYRTGRFTESEAVFSPEKEISYYSQSGSNASLASEPGGIYHLVWQTWQNNIFYTKIVNDNYGSVVNLSNGSGYENHWNPEVVVAGSMVYVGFVGQRFEAGEQEPDPIQWKTNAFGGGGSLGEWKERGLLRSFNGSNWSGIIKALGSDVNDIALNTAGSNVVFAYYTETNGWLGESYYTKGVQSADGFNSIFSISDGGKSFMLSNGSSVNNMKWFDVDFLSNHLEPLEPPYSLKNGNITTQYKVGSSDNYALIGREGITARDSVQFYFTFGEIIVDGVQVNFVEIPDSMKEIKNTNQLNKYLVSEPFTLNDNSEFTYGIMCGVADSSDVDIALKRNEFINFKVELIDGQSSHVLGVYDNVTFTADSINYYSNKNYLVNTNGVGSKTVRLRMQIKDNFKQSYSLGNLLVEDSLMYKKGYHELHYKGELLVKEYNLVQNYPNPFNPSTIIKYQIPKAGNVKLIVYDILGKEVAKLIDEFQNDGRYEVKFDASNLSSGIYIYRLEANDFVDSKKMMLVK